MRVRRLEGRTGRLEGMGWSGAGAVALGGREGVGKVILAVQGPGLHRAG